MVGECSHHPSAPKYDYFMKTGIRAYGTGCIYNYPVRNVTLLQALTPEERFDMFTTVAATMEQAANTPTPQHLFRYKQILNLYRRLPLLFILYPTRFAPLLQARLLISRHVLQPRKRFRQALPAPSQIKI